MGLALVGGGGLLAPGVAHAVQCARTVTATVVAHDQPTVFNRLGAQNPNWMMYSLERDLVTKTATTTVAAGTPCALAGTACGPGNVELPRTSAPARWRCGWPRATA
jgi:hypothetical protein